jgi:hypothetical protein
MKRSLAVALGVLTCPVLGAEVESRVLTHYLPQDFLEAAVRTEGWTEVSLKVAGGLRKGDVVRVWTGGLIDRGNGEKPGESVNGPAGADAGTSGAAAFALSPEAADAFALMFKGDTARPRKCLPPGKPLEVRIGKDNERLWLGFNDRRGHYADNHLGRGRRHEFDPLWVRIEVVRIIVD